MRKTKTSLNRELEDEAYGISPLLTVQQLKQIQKAQTLNLCPYLNIPKDRAVQTLEMCCLDCYLCPYMNEEK